MDARCGCGTMAQARARDPFVVLRTELSLDFSVISRAGRQERRPYPLGRGVAATHTCFARFQLHGYGNAVTIQMELNAKASNLSRETRTGRAAVWAHPTVKHHSSVNVSQTLGAFASLPHCVDGLLHGRG